MRSQTKKKESLKEADIEVFKPIGNGYLISNLGRVKNRHGKVMATYTNHYGYPAIKLRENNKYVSYVVHRLVALHFCHGDTSLTVNHINGVKTDNRALNLEWVTREYNSSHAHKLGLKVNGKGEACGTSKLDDMKVLTIRTLSVKMNDFEIAPFFGVCRRNISEIRRGRTWQHLPLK